MQTTLISSLPNRVICLGEILVDRLANDLGKSIAEVSSWTNYPGGAPANVACALVKLGIPSAFIGCIARDDLGQQLLQLLESIGVNIEGIQRNDLFPTRQVYVLRDRKGDRIFAGFGERPRVDERGVTLRNASSAKESAPSKGTREFDDLTIVRPR